nr:hypothetical protein [Tanacetum cinerariifolium]
MLLGRTAMQRMGIVVLTIHGAIKFHTEKGVRTVLLTDEAIKGTKRAKRIPTTPTRVTTKSKWQKKTETKQPSTQEKESSATKRCRLVSKMQGQHTKGLMLIDPEGKEYTYALRFEFETSRDSTKRGCQIQAASKDSTKRTYGNNAPHREAVNSNPTGMDGESSQNIMDTQNPHKE